MKHREYGSFMAIGIACGNCDSEDINQGKHFNSETFGWCIPKPTLDVILGKVPDASSCRDCGDYVMTVHMSDKKQSAWFDTEIDDINRSKIKQHEMET